MTYFAIVVVIKVRVFRIQGDKGGTLADDWTFLAIYPSYFIVVWGCIFEFFLEDASPVNVWVSMVGYVMATTGVAITRLSVLALNRWWSIRIEIKNDHKIVREGPYRISRHPYYLATLLELGGLCLILNSFRVLVYLAAVHVPILLARMRSEERTLIEKLGNRYLEYMKQVPILPRVSALALGGSGGMRGHELFQLRSTN